MANSHPKATKPTLNVEEPGQTAEKGHLEQSTKPKRKKWSTDENRDLMMCFFRAKAIGKYFGKTMNELWKEKHPDIDIGEKRLTAQKNTILRRKWFTDIELEEIERSAKEREGLLQTAPKESHDYTTTDDNTLQNTNERLTNTPYVEDYPAYNLTEYQSELRQKIIQKINTSYERTRLPKLKYTKKLTTITADANKAAETIPTRDITETNQLLYATASIVTEELGYKIAKEKGRCKNGREPPWKKRIQKKINNMRKDISRLKELDRQKVKKKEWRDTLAQKYHLDKRPIKQVIEELKQHVTALSKKIERYENRIKHYHQNRLFQTNQKELYKQLNSTDNMTVPNPIPNKDEVRTFWSDLWSKEKHHNTEAQWLKDTRLQNSRKEQQQELVFTEEKVKKMSKKIKNWKAPGKDEVHGYWIKHLPGLHNRIASQLQYVFENEIPVWMTNGKTTLIMKDQKKGPIPSNYRPITCLPTLWKLMSSIISDSLYKHLDEQGLIPPEQKGCSRGSRGTKDQLLIDKSILKDAKTKQKNLQMIWIDYKKAYDSVPHSWIIESLDSIKAHPSIKQFIQRSMLNWKTELMIEGESCGQCDINCGIFQGDSLSPLLFIVSLIPLTSILNKARKGYKLGNGKILNHLLYMDDLKLYGKTEREIESLLHAVRVFSTDIGMSFGIEKCARVSVKRGKETKKEGIKLPCGQQIRSLNDGDDYKYLGVLEKEDISHGKVKHNVHQEYKRRLKLILKSKLTGRNKIMAINTYAIPVVRYAAGIVHWTVEELQNLDRKTRKMMTIYRGLHPRADVDRLYLPRSMGGRGLKAVEDSVREEELAFYAYAKKDMFLRDTIKDTATARETAETNREFQKRREEERLHSYKSKTLHGHYFRMCEEKIDKDSTYLWLKKGDMKIETEGLLTAAQDQALQTNSLRSIYNNKESPLCRLCKERTETVEHLISGCTTLAGKEYKERHDKVAKNIHWHLCGKYGIERTETWWSHEPEAVVENQDVKILWDFNVYTDRKITARRPDIVMIDKTRKTAKLIDVSIPADRRIDEKEKEKIEKYQELRIEVERLWEMKTMTVPIVIGSLGAISKQFKEHLQRLNIEKISLIGIQKTVLLQTAYILRRVLQLSGAGQFSS